jgi:2,4-dienoyl-CoA reductase-like NADH-dependent reductase (Old Yellow Enzyme family)
LHRIVTETRAAVTRDFILGLKINAADYADSNTAGKVSPALDHVRTIAGWGSVDFIEISGGDYEKPGK